MIAVTRTFLPPREEFDHFLNRAWERCWITNSGINVLELEQRISDILKNPNFLFCTNGTVVLQMAIRALEIKGEIITTPFSYVATLSSILWENSTPVFADINSSDFCIDTNAIESMITDKTEAILATHVYGYPCDVDRIAAIAKKYNLKVIYDAAHAFGVSFNGEPLLNYGDVSTCSFHATKLFHTVEGGAILSKSPEIHAKIKLMRSFGHVGDDHYSLGINAKNSEFHAAMGLAVLPYLDKLIAKRKQISLHYDYLLSSRIERPRPLPNTTYNFAYYPILVSDEKTLLQLVKYLAGLEIGVRRYFYPSLNTLGYLKSTNSCPVSEDISRRVLCLPLYYDLEIEQVEKVAKAILTFLG